MSLTAQQQSLIDPNQNAWTDMNFSCTDEELTEDPSCRKTRNAGGPQYYHYIMNNLYNEDMPYQDFMDLHKVYCAVSGSPISDLRRSLTVQMKTVDEGPDVCGEYHMCCTPCFCDIQRFSKVEKVPYKFKEGEKDVHVLTIKDPCKNPLPQDVTSFVCSDGCYDDNKKHLKDAGDTCYTQNAERLSNDRIIIGVIQNGRQCSSEDIESVTSEREKHCSQRMTASSEELRRLGGMSNIWTELACNNDKCPNDAYYTKEN